MHVVAQPADQAGEAAGRELLVEVGHLGPQRLVELCGDEAAERVRGEVSEAALRPVHVLQAALGVVHRAQTEARLEPLAPRAGQVAHRQRTVEDVLLEVEAQHDVDRVGQFVGIDADRAPTHVHQGAVQILDLPLRARHAVVLLEQRPQVAQERPAAPDDHLEQQRLALLERHAAVAADRLVAPGLGQPEVVEGLAGLVQHAHQAREGLLRHEARGHPHVAAHALGERVVALVEPSAVEGEAEGAHHLDGERALLGGADLARDGQRRTAGLQLDDVADQGRQPRRERTEQPVDLGSEKAGTEAVDQRVVGLEAERLRQHLGLVARQCHDLLEVRHEQRKVGLLLGLEPADLGDRGGAGEARDQRDRRGDGAVALAAHLAQVGELPVLELPGRGLCALEQPRDARRGEQRVALRVERRELFAAHAGAAARHHHRGVPAQQTGRAPEGVQAPEFLLELLVGRERHGGCAQSAGAALPGSAARRRSRRLAIASGEPVLRATSVYTAGTTARVRNTEMTTP